MEYFDEILENGEKTGKIVSRFDAHKLGILHRTAHVWIMNSNNELLFQLRAKDKDSNPNLWDISSAGHISAGEDVNDGAVREVFEELGITVKKNELEFLFCQNQQYVDSKTAFVDNEIADVFLVRKDIQLDDFNIDYNELSDLKYLSILEFGDLIGNKNISSFVDHKEEYCRLFALLKK